MLNPYISIAIDIDKALVINLPALKKLDIYWHFSELKMANHKKQTSKVESCNVCFRHRFDKLHSLFATISPNLKISFDIGTFDQLFCTPEWDHYCLGGESPRKSCHCRFRNWFDIICHHSLNRFPYRWEFCLLGNTIIVWEIDTFARIKHLKLKMCARRQNISKWIQPKCIPFKLVNVYISGSFVLHLLLGFCWD